MIVCPVCEHPQAQGLECDVCGKDLSALGVPAGLPSLDGLDGLDGLGPPPTGGDLVPGLEVTIPAPIGDVPVERDPGLEASAFGSVGDVPVERVPDLEVASGMVGDVQVEPIPDLAVDRVPDDGVRTPVATDGAVTCRYCRNVQAAGMICEKCGMRLPRASAAQVAEIRGKPKDGGIRCRYCGSPNTESDERCRECGRPLPTAD